MNLVLSFFFLCILKAFCGGLFGVFFFLIHKMLDKF